MSQNQIQEEKVISMNNIPAYDPSKQYTWEPDAVFTLSGKEFGLWLNTIRGIVSSKEAMEIRMALECNNIIENIMTREVVNGRIKEVVNPKEE